MHGNGVDELRESTPSTLDDDLTQAQLLASVASVIDIWNTTTRSVALVFAGTTTADSNFQFCTAVTKRPAIFLHYDANSSGTGAHYEGSIASCSGEALGEIYVKGGGGNYFLGSQASLSTSSNFETILVHELGHAVGLGDINSTTECSTHVNVHSVMNGCASKPSIANGRWFPTSWDKDCADAFSSGRAVNYKWRGWTSTGATGTNELGSNTYGRGTFMGGYARVDTGGARYVLGCRYATCGISAG